MYRVKFSKLWDKMENVDLNDLKLYKVFKVNDINVLDLESDRLYNGKVDYDFEFKFKVGIVLVFKDSKGKGFMSIRSYNDSKFEFYKGYEGKRIGINLMS